MSRKVTTASAGFSGSVFCSSSFTGAVVTGTLFWLVSAIFRQERLFYLFPPSWVRAMMKLIVVMEMEAREIQKLPDLK